jgi:hypothetical protein
MRILYDANYHIIMDVGGGGAAVILAQIQEQLAEITYED